MAIHFQLQKLKFTSLNFVYIKTETEMLQKTCDPEIHVELRLTWLLKFPLVSFQNIIQWEMALVPPLLQRDRAISKTLLRRAGAPYNGKRGMSNVCRKM